MKNYDPDPCLILEIIRACFMLPSKVYWNRWKPQGRDIIFKKLENEWKHMKTYENESNNLHTSSTTNVTTTTTAITITTSSSSSDSSNSRSSMKVVNFVFIYIFSFIFKFFENDVASLWFSSTSIHFRWQPEAGSKNFEYWKWIRIIIFHLLWSRSACGLDQS